MRRFAGSGAEQIAGSVALLSDSQLLAARRVDDVLPRAKGDRAQTTDDGKAKQVRYWLRMPSTAILQVMNRSVSDESRQYDQ